MPDPVCRFLNKATACDTSGLSGPRDSGRTPSAMSLAQSRCSLLWRGAPVRLAGVIGVLALPGWLAATIHVSAQVGGTGADAAAQNAAGRVARDSIRQLDLQDRLPQDISRDMWTI